MACSSGLEKHFGLEKQSYGSLATLVVCLRRTRDSTGSLLNT